jgi:hypothetical protein
MYTPKGRTGSARAEPARGQTALVTLPALRQRVQTYSRRGAPFTRMRTFWRLGSKRRFVATIEWLREWPNPGPFLQEKQTFDTAGKASSG